MDKNPSPSAAARFAFPAVLASLAFAGTAAVVLLTDFSGVGRPEAKPAGAAAFAAASIPAAAPMVVHYGAATRSDIMGSAAGPVYN